MKPSLIRPALKLLIERQRPAFMWGPPGVGKSDTVAQVAKELKLELRDIRLSLMDPTDIKGFPMPSTDNKSMRFLPPNFLPTKGKGLLFFDEMNQAPQAVQAATYQLILNRAIGDYKLPDGWAIIAAGNRTTDRSVAHAMPAALANRFVHIDFDVDMEDWVDWAIANGISDATRGYIRYRPGNLVVSKIEPGARAFHTPRSWAFADQIINSGLAPEIEIELLKGTIGEGVAAEYMGFIRDAKNLPNIDKILMDPEGTEVPKSPSTQYALVSALDSRVGPNNFGILLKYVKRMSKEFEVVFASSSVRRDTEISETKAFTEWARENRSLLIS